MRIEKIHYEQLFPTGIYANIRLGVDIEVDTPHPSTGESNHDAAMDAFKEAKELVNKAFEKLNPGGVIEINYPIVEGRIDKSPKDAAIDSQIESIACCTSLQSLEIFKKLVDREAVPRLTEAFYKKQQELQ